MFDKGRLESTLLAVALLVAMPGFTASGSASAQVRSTIQASARVVEAGPAWAAHRDLQAALGELAESARLTGSGVEAVILTDRAKGPVSIARLVRMVRSDAGTVRGDRVQEEASSVRAASEADAFSGGRRSRSTRVRDQEGPRSRAHVIVYVEHVAN